MSDKNEQINDTVTTNVNALVFLNTPIHDKSEDLLGLQAHVDSLQAAIDSNAQMIAITSPFGAGKSSVTELLRGQRTDQRVINVSMWSHLCKDEDPNTTNSTIGLHRSFLYQIISQLSDKAGAYISRRLSNNYGLLKLHTENAKYYFVAFLSLVFFILGYVLPYMFHIGIPTIWGKPEIWNGLMLLASVVCLVYVVTRAEIVFSSNKSEGARAIDENELIELYRKFVLKYCAKEETVKKFIFVVEDLDRSDSHKSVITFLKELRKYYIQNSTNENNIVFIVNVKPETTLFDDAAKHKAKENESLYAKLFDYILNVQTINIDDYETVLESILQKNEPYIRLLFPDAKKRLVDIAGMHWIIWGKNFGVRDIKDRLNRAFTLFLSLRSRFDDSHVEFEKCAVVAYLTTAYEKEFHSTNDRSFGKLVEACLQNTLSKKLCQAELESTNDDYIDEILTMVQNKHIDSNYRMYFYNYPKNSRIYTHDESIVQKAILYKDAVEGIDEMVSRVATNNPKVIYDALDKLEKLKLPLPEVIFQYEPLYIATLHHYPDGVYGWMSKLDYSKNAFDKTSKQILSVLLYDSSRSVYSSSHAFHFCKAWEEHFGENELLTFRQVLCSCLSTEILWYASLFRGVHNLVTTNELDLLSLDNAIHIINTKKDSFSEKYIQYVLKRFEENSSQMEHFKIVTDFLHSAEDKLGAETVARYFLQFMLNTNTMIADFENSIMGQLQSDKLSREKKEELFVSYQKLVNALNPESITLSTIENIHILDRFGGYSESIGHLLEENGYRFDSILVRLHLGITVNYQEAININAINDNLTWLIKHLDIFRRLRLNIVATCKEAEVLAYCSLFSVECPILTVNEFDTIKYRYSDETLFSLIPPNLVTREEIPMLQQYFNRCFQQNTLAHNILLYISKMQPAVAKELFYLLNFDTAIKYCDFAATRRNSVKDAFNEILNLDAVSEKIRFMETTRYMDSAWEDQICDVVKSNSSHTKNYLAAANAAVAKSITLNTVKCICSLSGFHALNHNVTERLFTAKKYQHYVLSKALYNERFVLDDLARIDALWPTYLEIFSGTKHPTTRGYMDNNPDFLMLVMERKGYIGLPRDRRMVLSKILQDSDCLLNAVEYGDAFINDYLSKIAGFCNPTACETYLEIIEQKPSLLKSQVLYNHCHEMLHSSILKSKYTRLRKKYGYM